MVYKYTTRCVQKVRKRLNSFAVSKHSIIIKIPPAVQYRQYAYYHNIWVIARRLVAVGTDY